MGRKRRDIPWLDQRDNGVYYAYWYDDSSRQTRRESMDTRDLTEARSAFADFLKHGPKSTKHGGDAGVTVDQILTWYDTGVPGRYPGHVAETVVAKGRQRGAIANLRAGFRGVACKDVGIVETEAYARKRRAGEIGVGGGGKFAGNGDKRGANSTIRRELSALSAAARWCVKRRLLPADHMPQIEMPPTDEKKAPWLTKESVQMLFEGSEGKLRAFCRLAYYWGARRESVEHLWVSQIDLKHGRVDLHKPGAKRTKKRRPVVPVYKEIRKDLELLLLETDDEYLFGGPVSFYEDFVRLCKRLKIKVMDAPDDKAAWPHLLRHSRATHLLMDGEDIYKVAKLLGDTVATVERVYGHHTPEYLQITKGSLYDVG